MKRILWISRMEPNKRPLDALDMIRKLRAMLKDVELYMAGEGNLLSKVKEAARGIGGVHILGRVSDKEKEGLLKGCDVLISTSEFEGFGLTIGEAFLAGKAVITYNIPSIKSVYGDAVVYAETRDTNDFVRKLHRLLIDDKYRGKKASEGRKKVINEYSSEVVTTKIEKALREILKK